MSYFCIHLYPTVGMSNSQCFVNPEMCHLTTFCCINWGKPRGLIWIYTFWKLLLYSRVSWSPWTNLRAYHYFPSSSYFSVLHFLNCFQSLSEKATWNGFLEMLNVFLNVCSLMLLESCGLGSCMYSFPSLKVWKSNFWNTHCQKEIAGMGIWQKSDSALGKSQI